MCSWYKEEFRNSSFARRRKSVIRHLTLCYFFIFTGTKHTGVTSESRRISPRDNYTIITSSCSTLVACQIRVARDPRRREQTWRLAPEKGPTQPRQFPSHKADITRGEKNIFSTGPPIREKFKCHQVRALPCDKKHFLIPHRGNFARECAPDESVPTLFREHRCYIRVCARRDPLRGSARCSGRNFRDGFCEPLARARSISRKV